VLMDLFDRERWTLLSHLLIWHGRRVCDARRPRCAECVVAWGCPSRSCFMDGNSPRLVGAVTLGSDGHAPTPAQIPHSLPAEDNQA